jgi:reactive intermediate/imine deaminase
MSPHSSLSRFAALILFAVVTLGPADPASGQSREYINARSASDGAVLPFSGAVRVGETLYLSGTIGLNEDREIPATAEEEARLVLNSVQRTLEAAGMSMDDLVVVQVFCTDLADYEVFNSVYRTYFEQEFPARAFIGVGSLLFDARFEVQSIAVRRD